jgi:hypothetical protein
MSNTQAKVAIEKSEHPERFCPARRCLWRTAKLNHATGEREGGGYCLRHQAVKTNITFEEARQIVREEKRDAPESKHRHAPNQINLAERLTWLRRL